MNNNRLFYKKFFKYSITILFILIFSIITINIYVDKYGFFKNDYSKQKTSPNYRFMKIKHLLKNPNKYDSLIFGSSRAAYLNPKIIKSEKYYNLSFSVATTYENLRYLRMLINKGLKIKNVILCLDNDSFKYNDYPYTPASLEKAYAYFYYPETIPQKITFYSKCLLLNPFDKSDEETELSELDRKAILDSGTTIQLMNLKTYKRNTEKINKIYTKDGKYESINFKLLKEFVEICNQNNINLIVIILPEYYKSYKSNQLAGYNYCKKKLSEITPYYDFSGVNEVTTNNANVHDYRHLDYNVGCLVLDRIFKENKFSAPKIKGFGDYVTKDNFNEHIKTLCSKTPEIKNCIPKIDHHYSFQGN